jgi:hypothetical protein
LTDFSGILRTKQGPRIISSVGDVHLQTVAWILGAKTAAKVIAIKPWRWTLWCLNLIAGSSQKCLENKLAICQCFFILQWLYNLSTFWTFFCFHLPSVTLLQRLPDCNLFIPLLAICATAEACASRGPCLKAF